MGYATTILTQGATLTPSSVNDTNLLQYCTAFSRHTKQSIEKVNADKGYAGLPNREFLAENKIAGGIMRKNSRTATLTEYEIEQMCSELFLYFFEKGLTEYLLIISVIISEKRLIALKPFVYRYQESESSLVTNERYYPAKKD